LDSGLASLAIAARFHGKAAEPAQLAHELGLSGPARAEDLLLAARRLQLKAKLGPLDLERAAPRRAGCRCRASLSYSRPVSLCLPGSKAARPCCTTRREVVPSTHSLLRRGHK
jgi:hypothetical protein